MAIFTYNSGNPNRVAIPELQSEFLRDFTLNFFYIFTSYEAAFRDASNVYGIYVSIYICLRRYRKYS